MESSRSLQTVSRTPGITQLYPFNMSLVSNIVDLHRFKMHSLHFPLAVPWYHSEATIEFDIQLWCEKCFGEKEIWIVYHFLNWCVHVYFSPGRHLVLLLLSCQFRLHSSRLSSNSSCQPSEVIVRLAAAPLHSYPMNTPIRVTVTWPAQCLLCTRARLHWSSIFLSFFFSSSYYLLSSWWHAKKKSVCKISLPIFKGMQA